jgi:virginiamycin B lyase
VAGVNSNLQPYDVYWTSSSSTLALIPTTLPGQVVVDRQGNIYFPQHGGNRISEIRQEDGLLTEYDIPTGPLSTVLFLTASDDGRGVWFAEWASNKVAFLDTSIQVPFYEQIPEQHQTSITLTKGGTGSLDVLINSNASAIDNSSLSLSEVEVGLTGMTESGIMGVTYQANPPSVNLQENASAESRIQLQTQDNAKPGSYTAMVRVQAPEQDGLVISRLYPIELVLDVPQPATQTGGSGIANNQLSAPFDGQDLVRVLAIAAVVGLVGFILYRRVKRKPASSED